MLETTKARRFMPSKPRHRRAPVMVPEVAPARAAARAQQTLRARAAKQRTRKARRNRRSTNEQNKEQLC